MKNVAKHLGDGSEFDIINQMHRYFLAVYGKNYIYSAPETFPNALERWMLAVMHDSPTFASKTMQSIEDYVKKNKENSE